MGAAVGGSLLNKLNLGGLSGNTTGSGASVMASMQGLGKMGGGYQPRMFGAKTDGSGVESGNTSERSFTSRFGQGNPVSASIDVMPASHKFLGASGKNLMGPGSHLSQSVVGGNESETSSQQVYATPNMRNPQSRKSVLEDEDTPNTDEFQ